MQAGQGGLNRVSRPWQEVRDTCAEQVSVFENPPPVGSSQPTKTMKEPVVAPTPTVVTPRVGPDRPCLPQVQGLGFSCLCYDKVREAT
jgi:hypothetical protein